MSNGRGVGKMPISRDDEGKRITSLVILMIDPKQSLEIDSLWQGYRSRPWSAWGDYLSL
jgi:hypothetical protein